MKTVVWIVGAVIIIGGGYFAFTTYVAQNQPKGSSVQNADLVQQLPPQQNQKATTKTTPGTASTYAAADFVWRIENAPTYEVTMPRHIVFLDVEGRAYRVGESIGCTIESDATEPNEITRKTCWFGGGGDVYSVFKENQSYVVKHKWIQESGGPSVNAKPEGPYEVLFAVQ